MSLMMSISYNESDVKLYLPINGVNQTVDEIAFTHS